jgi:general stress protein 26
MRRTRSAHRLLRGGIHSTEQNTMTMEVEQGSIETLRKMIKDVKYAVLTTASPDGTLHSRPLTALEWEFDGIAWFLVARDSRLATEVSAIPEVNLAYASPEDDTFVSLAGRAQVLQDPARARALWNRWAEMFFPGGPDSPEVGAARGGALGRVLDRAGRPGGEGHRRGTRAHCQGSLGPRPPRADRFLAAERRQ